MMKWLPFLIKPATLLQKCTDIANITNRVEYWLVAPGNKYIAIISIIINHCVYLKRLHIKNCAGTNAQKSGLIKWLVFIWRGKFISSDFRTPYFLYRKRKM